MDSGGRGFSLGSRSNCQTSEPKASTLLQKIITKKLYVFKIAYLAFIAPLIQWYPDLLFAYMLVVGIIAAGSLVSLVFRERTDIAPSGSLQSLIADLTLRLG